MELSNFRHPSHEGILPRLEKQELRCKVYLENGLTYDLRQKANKTWEIVQGDETFDLLGFATWPSLPTEKDQIAEYMNIKYEVRKEPQVGRYIILKDPNLSKRVIASKILKID